MKKISQQRNLFEIELWSWQVLFVAIGTNTEHEKKKDFCFQENCFLERKIIEICTYNLRTEKATFLKTTFFLIIMKVTLDLTKGQLISKELFGVFNSPNKQTKMSAPVG